MKKIILLMLFVCNFSFAQEENEAVVEEEIIGTTVQEYNYLTVGYEKDILEGRISFESKLINNDAFILDNIDSGKVDKYDFKLSFFGSLKDKSKKASKENLIYKGYFMVVYSYVSKKYYYLCIPINNEMLSNMYLAKLKTFSPELLQAYTYFISNTMVQMTNQIIKN